MAQSNSGGTATQVPAKREVKDLLKLPETKEQILRVLPPGREREKVADRFLAVALRYAEDSQIMVCTPRSILASIVEAAKLGIEVGSARKHAYLVKFNNKVKDGSVERWVDEAQLIMGYAGLIYLGVKERAIRSARVRAVYKGDRFDVEYGSVDRIVHKPDLDADQSPENATHFYAIVTLPDSSEKFEVMTRAQVDAVRNRSKSKDSPAWRNQYDEMGKKVVLKRLFKTVPMGDDLADSRLATAIEKDNEAEFDSWQDPEERDSAVTSERTKDKLRNLKEKMQTGRDVTNMQPEPEPEPEPGGDSPFDDEQEPEAGDDTTPANLKAAQRTLKLMLEQNEIDEYQLGFATWLEKISGKTDISELSTSDIAHVIKAVEGGSKPKATK